MLAPTKLSLSNEQEKHEGYEISGLTNTRFCMSHEILISIFGNMVGDTLNYLYLEKHDLVQQFSIYFEPLGWKTEDSMAASAGISLLMPEDLVPNKNVVGMISPAIKLTLQRIA